MKESRLFLTFIRKNFILLIAPVFLGLLISIYFYSQQPPQSKLFQSFRFEYSLDNVDTVIALADQAVTELRIQGFDAEFPGSKAIIYKPGPLAIAIEVLSPDRNSGYELLLKETGYLRQNFTVSTLTEPQISIIEPNIFKYILTGVLVGFLAGLIVSLCREYLRNY